MDQKIFTLKNVILVDPNTNYQGLGSIAVKNGRIESEISYINGTEKNNISYIPPEALNGNPLGSSLKTFIQFQYFLNQSVSMTYSLNTINNNRYKNLIYFKGEIRAYF